MFSQQQLYNSKLCYAMSATLTIGILFINGNKCWPQCTREVLFDPPTAVGGVIGDDIAVDDFNGDGISDLALTAANGVFIRLGNGTGGLGDGTFAPPVGYPTASARRLEVADLDNDGVLDEDLALLVRQPVGEFFW